MEKKYFEVLDLKSKVLKSIVCILIAVSFILPGYMVTADDPEENIDASIEIVEYIPVNPEENDTVVLTTSIVNNGDTDIENLDVLFIYDNNNKIGTKTIELLKTNESVNISINWRAIRGNHTIIAMGDPDNDIPETNETNNVDQKKIYVISNTDENPSDENPGNAPPEVTRTRYGDDVKYEHLSNGLIRATIPFPTVFNEEKGKWEPADLNVYWNGETSEWQPKKSRMDVSFKNDLESNGLYRFEVDESWVEYSLNEGKMTWKNYKEDTSDNISAVSSSVANVQEDEITYEEIFDHTSLKYKVLPFGVKEYFVLDSPPDNTDVDESSTVLAYEGKLSFSDDLTIWVDGIDNTNQDFRTSSRIEFRMDNEAVFWFTHPFAYDSNLKDENYSDCYYNVKTTDNGIKFSIEVPADWLLSPDRIYPVFIDPTIEILNPLEDTYSRSYKPNNIYGGSTYMKVNPYPNDKNRAYLKFDLSEIPSNSDIVSATFRYYYYYHISNPGGRIHDFHKITETWDEDTLTWNYQPSYDSAVISSYTFPYSFGWIEADITQYVQYKIDGETDYGFMIKDHNEGDSNNRQPRMYSKEAGTNIPELVVEYTATGGPVYQNDFSSDPNLQGSNYNDYAKANWNSAEERIDWVGRRDTDGIDRYFIFDGVSMDEPVFNCDFWATSYTSAGQRWGLVNHFRLKTSDGKYIGFDHTMDSDRVGSGNRGIRGEFYNGGSSYTTPWILVNDGTTYDIRVYIEGGMGKIEVGSSVESISLSGSFSGTYNSFHFELGGVPSASDHNGASGWFDNLEVGISGGGSIYTEDFENEAGYEWSTHRSSLTYGRNERSTYSAQSGSYSWRMDVTSNGHYNLNELILHVSVSGASYLNLDFHTREYGDEKHIMPSSFTDHTNADGIAVSTNGLNWEKLWQYPSSVSGWTAYGPFDVGSEISISGDVYIKFQQYDNYKISSDGILWDDITLETDGTIIVPTFTLPDWGGAMVHSDPHLTDYINLPTPTLPLGDEWSTYSSTSYGRNDNTFNSDYVYNGESSWSMDVTEDGNYNLNEMILHVEMSGASYLDLSFYTKEYGDEKHIMPSSFTDHTNADGIAVSTNGLNWEKLWQYPSSVSSWTEYGPPDIPDIGSVISISGDVYIKFQQYDNWMNHGTQSGSDGILWDDITLETDGTITLDSGETVSTYTEDFELAVWIRDYYPSEQAQNFGNGVAGNGKIAAVPFCCVAGNNLIVYDYDGNRIWKSGNLLNALATSSTPMVSKDNKVIMCDNEKVIMVDPYINDDDECVWSTEFPGGWFDPVLSPTITENGVIILPTSSGDLQAIDSNDGTSLGTYELPEPGSGYKVINSACVDGNRVYVLAEKTLADSRLYAIDIDPEAPVFTPGWDTPYEYPRKSQASPTFIDNTLYFDVYLSIATPSFLVGACAIEDLGTEYNGKWIRYDYDWMTWFSLTADPRGGIWYENTHDRKLVRIDTDDGTVMESISLEYLMGDGYRPISVMQICGDETNPIMIVSANNPLVKCYVIAIDLEFENNKLLWKYRIQSEWDCNYAGGQYTILLDDEGNNPRIVFGGYWGGVYALGE